MLANINYISPVLSGASVHVPRERVIFNVLCLVDKKLCTSSLENKLFVFDKHNINNVGFL